mmetsp:Transcript_7414/g.31431  ORF Transcript_7414/g.31431 Transcript_7414/m.31431 type:complete len:138 (-) Transcript_7414:53-466(-)
MRRRPVKSSEAVVGEERGTGEGGSGRMIAEECTGSEESSRNDSRSVRELMLNAYTVMGLLWEKTVSLLEEDLDEEAQQKSEEYDEADVLLSKMVTSVNIYILGTCLLFSMITCMAYIGILLSGLMDATASTKFGVVK